MPGPNTATYLERLLTFFQRAADILFDPTGTGLTATTVQDAIVEVSNNVPTLVKETMSELRAVAPIDGRIAWTACFSDPDDGGGGTWTGVTGAVAGTYTHNGGTVIVPVGGNGSAAWLRVYTGPVQVQWFGALPDGDTDCTAAIQAAVDYVSGLGGGTVQFSEGTYLVTDGNPGAASWDNNVAIWILSNNVSLLGAGVGATKILLADSGDAHLIKFGQRTGGTVTVSSGSVSGMSLDGNRANQSTPNDTDDHWNCIDVVSGCSQIRLSDLHITNAPYYGIGMQRDEISDSTIENIVIENTGADGIDWKNDTGTGTGNAVRNITVRNFGLLTGLSNPQAGVDLRSGVYAENITIEDMTATPSLHGVRVLTDGDGSSFTVPRQPTKLSKVTVLGDEESASIGLYIAARNTVVDGVTVRECGDGVFVTRPDCRLTNIETESNVGAGLMLTDDPTIATEADTCFVSGLVSRSNAYGVVYDSVDEVTVIGADVRNNTTIGHDIRTGSTNIKILGGSCNSNTTQISNAGTNITVQDVTGLRTRNVVTGTAAIDSTGTKDIVIAHSLGVIPVLSDVQLTMRRNTNVGDWSAGFLWVSAVDATNVTAQLRVLTASGTGGALVTVQATVETLNGR